MQNIEMIRSQNCNRDDVLELCDAFEKLRDGTCLEIIPGTVIICGEGGNFCSQMCSLYRAFGDIYKNG